MKTRLLCSAGGALVLLAVLFVALDAEPVAAEATTFSIDASHSAILFSINHLGVSHTWGRFNEFEGSFALDEANPKGCSVSVTVDTTSIDTGNEGRDDHLRGPDFFNAEQFPEITFQSTSVAKTDKPGVFDVTGDLTLHGVKKAITVRMTKVGEKDLTSVMPQLGYRAGFEGTLTIKRSEYGMTHWVPNIGDDVRLILSFEGVRE